MKELYLFNNQIGDVGLVALAPTLRQLPITALNMGDNQIGDGGLAALIAQPMAGVLEMLQVLDIGSTHITDAGCTTLASALRSGALPALKRVDLRENDTRLSLAQRTKRYLRRDMAWVLDIN